MPVESFETQELKERLEEASERHESHGGGVRWTLHLSLSTALIAVGAAVAALLSGNYESRALLEKNDAVLEQAQASDAWSYFQAKGVKSAVYAVQAEALGAGEIATKLRAEAQRYRSEQLEIEHGAHGHEEAVKEHGKAAEEAFERHHKFALAVTVFQVSIALSAIAALTKRKPLWFVSMGVGGIGLYFLVHGLMG